MFDTTTIRAAMREAKLLGIEAAALLALAEVESNGKIYALVDGRNEPLVRFEGHYFDKRVVKLSQAKARAAGLANPKMGGVKNPISQQSRWDRLINPAALIDKQAAYESVSWGLGQVMGSHWKWLGYSSVVEMVEVARSGAAGQIQLMARFIDKSGLTLAIKKKNWTALAKGYNGPSYKVNQYDIKIAKAYSKWLKFDYSKLNTTGLDYQKSPETIIKPIRDVPDAVKEMDDLVGTVLTLPEAPPLPRNKPPVSGEVKAGGLVVAITAALVAAQCSLPTWFIQWAGYAAKCTKGLLQ